MKTLPEPMKIRDLFEMDPETGLPRAKKRGVSYGVFFEKDGTPHFAYMGNLIPVANLVWAMHLFEWPDRPLIFKDGNGLNLGIDNLELGAIAPDPGVLPPAPKYKGVVRLGPYIFRAQRRIDGVLRYLGNFDTAEAADAAVKASEAANPPGKRGRPRRTTNHQGDCHDQHAQHKHAD